MCKVRAMRKFLILVLILALASCSLPFGKKKAAQPPEKSTKGERVDSGSEPKPGDIKLVDGIEYIYARNRRYNTLNSEPEYVWYRKDQYSPGLFESVKGSLGSSSTDKKERAELEKRLAKLESDAKAKGGGSSGQQVQVVYAGQPSLLSGTSVLPGTFAPSFNYPSPKMKRRILILPLSDQTNYQDEHLNELATKRLINRLENSGTIICVDPQSMDIKGDPLTPQTMDKLNELYGIQAVVRGSLSDIYITTSRGDGRDEKEVSMAVSKLSLDVYNTETGNILRQISARNPFSLSRERGDMSPEKAKVKAIDLAIELLSDDLLKTILTLDWHARIASIDNEKIYINAGRLSGLGKGDILEVYSPGDQIVDKTTALPLGKIRGSYKGELEVVDVFGVDASWGKTGKTGSFTSTDLVYLKKQ
jgi:hypothetical protein